MALRIDPDAVLKAEFSNRAKGRVTGVLWLRGAGEPVGVILKGDPHRDLAGRLLRIRNADCSNPEAREHRLHKLQEGRLGDFTASRKVRVPTVNEEDFAKYFEAEKPIPTTWENSIYLEWFSAANGRVVLEATGFEIEISETEWTMTAEEEAAAGQDASKAFTRFLETFTIGPDDDAEPRQQDDRPGIAPAGGPLDEFEWEKLLKESDQRSDAIMEIYDKYQDDPQPGEKIAEFMGWNEHPYQGEFAMEPSPWDDVDPDEIHEPGEAPNPLRDKVIDLARALDRSDLEANPRALDLWAALTTLSAKLAGALDRFEGDDEELRDPGFTIALLKRCLNQLDHAVGCAQKLGDGKALIEKLFAIRESILAKMKELRGDR